jgi:hypothetical protein
MGCQRLAPGDSEVLAEWGGPDAGVYIADVTAGAACDQFITGTTWGPLELGGQTLEAATFIAHREASGEIGWVKAWKIGEVDWSELAAAHQGGVWGGGHANVSTPDLGDGVLRPVGDRGRILARYAADGSLVALRVDADRDGFALASDVAAQRITQMVYDDEGARLELLDDAAELVWSLPRSDYWSNLNAAPGSDGGVVAVGVEQPEITSILEHYDGAGAALWREAAPGSRVRSLAVSSAGEVVLSGSYCARSTGFSSECDEEGFVRLIEPSGDTRFEIAHGLGPTALVTSNGTEQVLLIGEDASARRLVLQRVDRDGRLGERHLFDGPATLDPLRGSASGKSVWIAGTQRGKYGGDGVFSVDRGFLLEMGL